MEFIAGVESELSARSIALTIQLAETVPGRDRGLSPLVGRAARRRRPDGRPSHRRPSRRRARAARACRRSSSAGLSRAALSPSVSHDEASVVVDAVRYLAALGHTRIGRVAGVSDFVHTTQRTEAFRGVVAGPRALGGGPVNRLHRRERRARDAEVPVRARAADGDRLRQRPAGGHRAGRRAAHGLLRPGRPLDRGLGRLAHQPGRASRR